MDLVVAPAVLTAAMIRLLHLENPVWEILEAAEVESLEVEFDAFPGMRLPAEITEIGTEASLTTRTFPITLSMKQPEDNKILAGMAGTAFATATV